MRNSNNWFHKHHTSQMNLYIYHKRKSSISCGATLHQLGLSLSLFFHSFVSSHCFSIPFLFAYLLPYIDTFCFYPYSYPVANRVFRDIFLSFIGFFPSLILKFWLLKVFVLFRQSRMHSIRQRLGGSPLINAEVKIFILLTYSERFPEILDTNWK